MQKTLYITLSQPRDILETRERNATMRARQFPGVAAGGYLLGGIIFAAVDASFM